MVDRRRYGGPPTAPHPHQACSEEPNVTSLVIVESPNKVRSIAAYLGDGYVVSSSVGHIRDLPQGADQIPAKYKGESWARLGVDVDNRFEPVYVVPAEKKKQ